MKLMKHLAKEVAVTDATVLITGESGTGKELFAQAIHAASPRAQGPLIALNCAGIPENLLEAELFGYQPGAFTDAKQAKPGKFQVAEGGTLFLDEIAEMSGPMQVSLLRFLDLGEYRPVGSTRTWQTDARLIGATNQDIQALVAQGRFREDLLYRINAVTLRVPPLRERTEDIAALTEHLLQSVRAPGLPARPLSPEAVRALTSYPWPGNIRELRNVIERIVMLGTGKGAIAAKEVSQALPKYEGSLQPGELSHCSLDEIERLHIMRVLEFSHGNKTQAAKTLQIDYKTLLSKLKKYDIGR